MLNIEFMGLNVLLLYLQWWSKIVLQYLFLHSIEQKKWCWEWNQSLHASHLQVLWAYLGIFSICYLTTKFWQCASSCSISLLNSIRNNILYQSKIQILVVSFNFWKILILPKVYHSYPCCSIHFQFSENALKSPH